MMPTLTLGAVLYLHQEIIATTGGRSGLISLQLLQSAIHQPLMTFDGADLYPSVFDKAAALGYSLIQNHPFIEANERLGHAAMDLFLHLNQWRLLCEPGRAQEAILAVASGRLSRDGLRDWLKQHSRPQTLPAD